MIRVVIGAVAAAVAMFVIGFILFATPLGQIPIGSLDDQEAAAVQSVLAANLPADGADTVLVPAPDEGAVQQRMYIDGPMATIHYNPDGHAVADSGAMLGGFVHMLVSALILGLAIYGLSRHVHGFAERMKIIVIFVFAASCFMHLGTPIWMHQDWTYHIYTFFADALMFIVAGGIIARWFLPREEAPPSAS